MPYPDMPGDPGIVKLGRKLSEAKLPHLTLLGSEATQTTLESPDTVLAACQAIETTTGKSLPEKKAIENLLDANEKGKRIIPLGILGV